MYRNSSHTTTLASVQIAASSRVGSWRHQWDSAHIWCLHGFFSFTKLYSTAADVADFHLPKQRRKILPREKSDHTIITKNRLAVGTIFNQISRIYTGTDVPGHEQSEKTKEIDKNMNDIYRHKKFMMYLRQVLFEMHRLSRYYKAENRRAVDRPLAPNSNHISSASRVAKSLRHADAQILPPGFQTALNWSESLAYDDRDSPFAETTRHNDHRRSVFCRQAFLKTVGSHWVVCKASHRHELVEYDCRVLPSP